MTTDDTAKRLEEIERREQARSHAAWPTFSLVSGQLVITPQFGALTTADAEFFALVWSEIPCLLAQLKAAREQLDQAIATRQAALAGVVERWPSRLRLEIAHDP